MTKSNKYLIIAGSILALLLIPTMTTDLSFLPIAQQTIIDFENFSEKSFWDFKQWTWGYGTLAPGPNATITQEQAAKDLTANIKYNYNLLRVKITRSLNANQWAALLSFAFNEGIGAAYKLVPDINAGDDSVLENHFKEYVYAGGVVNDGLVTRRNNEWDLWQS